MFDEEITAIECFAQAFDGRSRVTANKSVAPASERLPGSCNDWWNDACDDWPGGLASFPPPINLWATPGTRLEVAAGRKDDDPHSEQFDHGCQDWCEDSHDDRSTSGLGSDRAAA